MVTSIDGRSGAAFLDPTNQVIEDASNSALESGVNIAQLIVQTYNAVEAASHAKSHAKIDTLEKHRKKLEIVTHFLNEIETQLSSNPNADVNMKDKQNLVEDLHAFWDYRLLTNGDKSTRLTWNRTDADILRTALTRHSQVIMQEIHHSSSEVNRAIEEGTELLQIARKVLEMCDRLHQTFTTNQRRQ